MKFLAENPPVSTAFDIASGVIFVGSLVLLVLAAISFFRVAKDLSGKQALLWMLLILILPVIGPLVWLIVGRRRARAV